MFQFLGCLFGDGEGEVSFVVEIGQHQFGLGHIDLYHHVCIHDKAFPHTDKGGLVRFM